MKMKLQMNNILNYQKIEYFGNINELIIYK